MIHKFLCFLYRKIPQCISEKMDEQKIWHGATSLKSLRTVLVQKKPRKQASFCSVAGKWYGFTFRFTRTRSLNVSTTSSFIKHICYFAFWKTPEFLENVQSICHLSRAVLHVKVTGIPGTGQHRKIVKMEGDYYQNAQCESILVHVGPIRSERLEMRARGEEQRNIEAQNQKFDPETLMQMWKTFRCRNHQERPQTYHYSTRTFIVWEPFRKVNKMKNRTYINFLRYKCNFQFWPVKRRWELKRGKIVISWRLGANWIKRFL